MFPPPFIQFTIEPWLLLPLFGFSALVLFSTLAVAYLKFRHKWGKQRAARHALCWLPLCLALWVALSFLCNVYYSQVSTTLDPLGIHWSNILGKRRSIAWNEITELRIQKDQHDSETFVVHSSHQDFQIELSLLRAPNEFIQLVQSQTHLKVSSSPVA